MSRVTVTPDPFTLIPFAWVVSPANWVEDQPLNVVQISGTPGASASDPASIDEYGESTFLYAAACNPDPVLRLTGVNRALEGLAIDVFNTMRDFGAATTDPVLYFCEDWMLADEVTHVKMGSDWLRKLTANDKERQERALEFQRVVDKLFSLGGFRGEEEDSPVRLARRFRELAGFQEDEISDLVDTAAEAFAEAQAMQAAAAANA